jgi:hypothetical protein
MPIKMACPTCQRPYTMADTMAGKMVKCKGCDKPFRVDAASQDVAAAPAEEVTSRRDRDRGPDRAPPPDERRRDDDFDFDRDSDRDRDRDRDDRFRKPRRKGRGIPMWVWFASGGGLLAILLVVLLFVFLGGNNLTEENFKRLKFGMTEAEVKGILGRPTRSYSSGDTVSVSGTFLADVPEGVKKSKVGQNEKVFYYRNGKNEAFIGFLDGKFVGGLTHFGK